MILELDAGNTFIKWRLLNKGVALQQGRLLTAEFSAQSPLTRLTDLEKIRVASVAGDAVNQKILNSFSSEFPKPQFAKSEAKCAGVTNSYADPSRMGVDRWLAMLAAYNRTGRACCVIDCGSAITIDYIADDGTHEGGYIMPGLRLMQQGLLSNTAEILVDRDINHFDISPGRHTSAAVIHGINFQFEALAEKVASDLVQNEAKYHLCITGGDGGLFQELAHLGELIPELVMDGLIWSCD